MKTKIIEHPQLPNNPPEEKISLEKMRELWNDEKGSLADDELIRVRDWMYVITGVIIRVIQKMKQQALIISRQSGKHENAQSNSICPRINGRTGRKRA